MFENVTRLLVSLMAMSRGLSNAVASDPVHGLPAIVVYSQQQPITNRIKVVTECYAFWPGPASEDTTNRVQFDGKAQIHVRGASSTLFPKRSFALEIQDGRGEDKKVPLCNLPAESDWVLYASFNDRTFVRGPLGYALWGSLGYWAPRTRYVDLFIYTNLSSQAAGNARAREPLAEPSNTGPIGRQSTDVKVGSMRTNQQFVSGYQGVYVLVEKIKRGKERVRIKKMEDDHDSEPEITGGYIFKKDRLGPGEQGFRTKSGIRLTFVEPKEREITDAQRNWLTNHLNDFEAALFGPDFADPEIGYAKYIDIDSFIDYHWLTEIGKNMDGYRLSQFYHKDRGGKLKMGPVWDWDLSFGNAFYHNGYLTNTWRWESMDAKLPEYSWFSRLFEDPNFLQR